METIAVMTELKRITVGEYVSDYDNMIENNNKDEIILKVGLSTRVDKDKYSEGIYLVKISGEIIGLRRSKRRRNKKKVCYI